jgi:hypothetical protein
MLGISAGESMCILGELVDMMGTCQCTITDAQYVHQYPEDARAFTPAAFRHQGPAHTVSYDCQA